MHMQGKIKKLLLSSLVVACGSLVTPSHADTLTQAFAAAYKNNPTIDAQRAQLRALDEDVAIARSGYRPTISATGTLNWERLKTSGGEATAIVGSSGPPISGNETSRTADYGINLSQSLFTGLQVTNRVRAAEALVRAGRAQLRSAEQELFIRVVTAYSDILVGRSAVKLFEAGARDATRVVEGARKRLNLQETTRTDVAQAQAGHADILARLAQAQGRLKNAHAEYLEFTGIPARRLRHPSPPLKQLPRSLQSAISIATKEHPVIVSALYNEQAARHNIDELRGRLMPQLGVTASYERSKDIGGGATDTTSLSANLTVPLYEGGANHAGVRRAKQLHISILQTVAAERSRIRRQVTTAWNELKVAQRRVRLLKLRIKANKATIVGVRKEETIGQRTINDLLEAQRDLLISENELLIEQQRVLRYAYQVLAEIGALDPASYLPSNAQVYDASLHYHDVRRRWFGLSITYSDGRREIVDAKGR